MPARGAGSAIRLRPANVPESAAAARTGRHRHGAGTRHPMDIRQQLAQEWSILQGNHEAHERSALLLKLAAVALFALAASGAIGLVVLCSLLLILWLQEAVLKTWQSRLAARLAALEALFHRGVQDGDLAFQLHGPWLLRRTGVAGLLSEYLRSGMRPTVAFPYAALLALAVVL